MALFTGKQKISFCKKLGTDWPCLADYFEIDEVTRNRFAKGDEARGIWAWLEARDRFKELYEALDYIGRVDLVVGMKAAGNENQSSLPRYLGNPFPGLRAFTEQEHAIFFGRETEIKQLLERLKETRFLAIIGPSGSGKSSLVRAGILANLKKLPVGEYWDWLRFTPGGLTQLTDNNDPDPFKAFAAVLGPKIETENLAPLEIARQLYQQGNIADMVQHYLHANPQSKELLLFIDQFEELFSLVNDAYRQRFIAMLERANHCQNLHVIITVRADFHAQCLNYPTLAGLINQGAWHLASPDLPALWRMITLPAKAAGIDFEEGVAEQILRDTGSGAGALALMAFALKQLYQQCRPSRLLSRKIYDQIGGVKQAIGQYAETIYQTLDIEAQAAIDPVFAELITVDPEWGIATRRRAAITKICASPASKRLFDAFTSAYLFVTDTPGQDERSIDITDGAIAEVAHEALFTHWDLLKNWIDDRFSDFCLLRQVRMEAAEWERNGRAEANLWPHERLQKVYAMQQKLKPQLSASVCAFIRPEVERLVEKLNNPTLTHQQRERIGARLGEIDDPRPGVGVDEKGLPKFEWCEVAPGRIVLENNAGTFNVKPFFISQYPVTFKQYRAFLEAADGYHNECWWPKLEPIPKLGEQQYRKIDNHPAENVSWFDAMAFCRWLSDKMGFTIRLPTEWEWQQAATGGNPENVYPWGKTFDSLRGNTYESGLGRTATVGLYPNGKSPFGALDMSGNVWEWCANAYDKPKHVDVPLTDRRVVRGGSWNHVQLHARTVSRRYRIPGSRLDDLGFRVVCSSPIISHTKLIARLFGEKYRTYRDFEDFVDFLSKTTKRGQVTDR